METIAKAQRRIARAMAAQPPMLEGTVAFSFHSEQLQDANVILEAASGAHTFHLEREATPRISYFYWSPGTGSYCATIDLTTVPTTDAFQIVFIWSRSRTQLSLQPIGTTLSPPIVATGIPTDKSFRVVRDGTIIQVGDVHAKVMSPHVYVGDKPLLLPTALEVWTETKHAADVLLGSSSDAGYMFDVAICNSVLSGLVTGFATYCKRRFIELEQEGITPNIQALRRVVAPNSRERRTIVDDTRVRASKTKSSILACWIEYEDRINFQNFSVAADAFKKSYGILFNRLGLSENELESFSRYFVYRNRIQHVSPLLTLYDHRAESPIFSTKNFAQEAVTRFSDFVDRLHDSTLTLPP